MTNCLCVCNLFLRTHRGKICMLANISQIKCSCPPLLRLPWQYVILQNRSANLHEYGLSYQFFRPSVIPELFFKADYENYLSNLLSYPIYYLTMSRMEQQFSQEAKRSQNHCEHYSWYIHRECKNLAELDPRKKITGSSLGQKKQAESRIHRVDNISQWRFSIWKFISINHECKQN